jgi:hypothetical protein
MTQDTDGLRALTANEIDLISGAAIHVVTHATGASIDRQRDRLQQAYIDGNPHSYFGADYPI